MMRSASRFASPKFPVSMRTDSPAGVTNSTALPPSTSTTYMSNVVLDCARIATAATRRPMTTKARRMSPSIRPCVDIQPVAIEWRTAPRSPQEEERLDEINAIARRYRHRDGLCRPSCLDEGAASVGTDRMLDAGELVPSQPEPDRV